MAGVGGGSGWPGWVKYEVAALALEVSIEYGTVLLEDEKPRGDGNRGEGPGE